MRVKRENLPDVYASSGVSEIIRDNCLVDEGTMDNTEGKYSLQNLQFDIPADVGVILKGVAAGIEELGRVGESGHNVKIDKRP